MENNDPVITKLNNHLENLKNARVEYEKIWDDVIEYVVPGLSPIFDQSLRHASDRRMDDTAIQSNKLMADSLHSAVTAPKRQWFSLAYEDPLLMESREHLEKLEVAEKRLYHAINISNFQQEIQKQWLMQPSIGTSSVMLEDVDERGILRFETYPIHATYISEGIEGVIDTIFVRRNMTIRQILQKWPHAIKSSLVKDKYETNSESTLFVIHYIGPKDGFIPLFNPLHTVASVYYIEDDCFPLNRVGGMFGGYHEYPVFTNRWLVMPGEVYGNSPTHDIMQSIKCLNRVVYYKDIAIPLAINPPQLTTPNNLITLKSKDGRIGPGTVVVVKDVENIRPLLTGANFLMTETDIALRQTAIKQNYYYEDLLLRPDKNDQSATEINYRAEVVDKFLGLQAARAHTELLDPLLYRSYNILVRAGIIDKPLDAEFRIRYLGTMTTAQKRYRVNGLMEYIGYLNQVALLDPSVTLVTDKYKVALELAESMDITFNVIRSEEDFKAEVKKLSAEEMAIQKERNASSSAMREKNVRDLDTVT